MRSGIRMADDIVSQSAFDGYRGARLRPTVDIDSDDQLEPFRERVCGKCLPPQLEPAAWVSMTGLWSMPAGLVRGVSGLRVVDASIMPEITNGNLNAPVVMMAEKISDSMLR